MDRFDPYREWLGIEPGEQPPDHYRLLGLEQFEGDVQAISRSADQRMAEVRKYQTGPRGRYTQALLNQLATARHCLLNPDSKSLYDQRLRAASQVSAATNYSAPAPSPTTQNPSGLVQPISTPLYPAVPPPPPPPPPRALGSPAAVAERFPQPGASGGPSGWTSGRDESAPRRSHSRRSRRMSSGAGCQVALLLTCLGLAGFAWWVVWLRSDRPRTVASRSTPLVTSPLGPAKTGPDQRPANPSTQSPPPAAPPVRDSVEGPIVIVQEGSGEVNLPPAVGILHGESIRLGDPQQPDAISQWTSMDDWIEWHFRLVRAGVFRMQIRYAVDQDAVGGEFELLVDGKSVKTCVLRAAAEGQDDVTDEYFVPLARGGEHRLALRPASKPGAELMRLFEVRLKPTTASRDGF